MDVFWKKNIDYLLLTQFFNDLTADNLLFFIDYLLLTQIFEDLAADYRYKNSNSDNFKK